MNSLNRLIATTMSLSLGITSCLFSEEELVGTQSLEQCLSYAQEHSPVLQQRIISHENRLWDELIARSAFDLRINYDGTLSDDDANHNISLRKAFVAGFDLSVTGNIRDGFKKITNDSSSLSIRLSKQILGGGSYRETRNPIDDAVLDIASALNTVNLEKRRIISQIKPAFYQIIRDTQSLKIQERRLETARRNLAHARERERPLDIATAEIQVPENELSVLRQKRNIESGLNRLKELMGFPVEDPLELNLDFDFELVTINVDEDIRYAIENHEDFLNNLLNRKKIDEDLLIQKAQIWPDVTLNVEHVVSGETDRINLKGGDEQLFSLNFSWPLGNRRDYAEYQQEKNRFEDNALDFYILKQAKIRRLLNLSQELDEVKQSIALQEKRLKLVEFQVELFKDRWENGEIDILELVRSQNSFEDTKVTLINLKIRYLTLLADYNFEVGR